MKWEDCPEHVWRDVESQFENDVVCVVCTCPGERQSDGTVYWPAA